jgi:hypothetical protein
VRGDTAGGEAPRGRDAWKAAESARSRELRGRVLAGAAGRYGGRGRPGYQPGMNRRGGDTP